MSEPTGCICSPGPSPWQIAIAAAFPHAPTCPLAQIDGQTELLPDPRTTTEVPF